MLVCELAFDVRGLTELSVSALEAWESSILKRGRKAKVAQFAHNPIQSAAAEPTSLYP